MSPILPLRLFVLDVVHKLFIVFVLVCLIVYLVPKILGCTPGSLSSHRTASVLQLNAYSFWNQISTGNVSAD